MTIIHKFIVFACLLLLILLVPLTTASAAPVMTSPSAGSTLTQSTQTFTWNANGTTGITQWYLYIGTTSAGSLDVYAGSQGLNTSSTISGLPTNGGNLYVRLWYYTTQWNSIDITYTACTSCSASLPNIAMSSPIDGSTFLESYQNFQWQASNI